MLPTDVSASDATAGAYCIRLRGLPFQATEQDVLAFFAKHDVVERISEGRNAVRIVTKANGKPSGQAVVEMLSEGDAKVALQVLTGQYMGSRYIEVFPHTEGDGASAAGTLPAAAAAATAAAQVFAPPQTASPCGDTGGSGGPTFPPMQPSQQTQWPLFAPWDPRMVWGAPGMGPQSQALVGALQTPQAQGGPFQASGPLPAEIAAALMQFQASQAYGGAPPLAGDASCAQPRASPTAADPHQAAAQVPLSAPPGVVMPGSGEVEQERESSWEALFDFLKKEGSPMAGSHEAFQVLGAPPQSGASGTTEPLQGNGRQVTGV